MSLRRLIQDRELDLLDGTKLLNHDKFDSLTKELKSKNIANEYKILRIHPSFRIIATAEPPNPKSSFASETPTASTTTPQATSSAVNSAKTSNTEWLNSEVLNLFLYQQIEPLNLVYEREILSKKFKLNSKHEKLLDLMEQLKHSGQEEIQLRHVSKLFSLRKLVRLSNKLEKYPSLDLKELIENACLYKFMPQLNKQILSDFLSKNDLNEIELDREESLSEIKKSLDIKNLLREEKTSNEKSLDELAKIPDTLFYENKLHTIILNNLMRDYDLGEHLLLIGNQGTGKNKLVDKFLMLTNKPREYIQLHRDTTVYSLTVQPAIKKGIIYYEDSPLVKAVKEGRVLVIDEADKAPLHVTSILKSLVESGEMILSDGRKIVQRKNMSSTSKNDPRIIAMHEKFRMIILANRPGFPFLGNDFFAVLGDLISVHPIDNPDPLSEIEMLRMYAPNISENVLSKLVSAFGSLRQLSDQGLISYPYSTRELVNIVKHLEKFPSDTLSNVLANVYDFDHFSEQSDLKSTFQQVMHKHGIPIGISSFNMNLAQPISLPAILSLQKFSLKPIESESLVSLVNLEWKILGNINDDRIKSVKCEHRETRVDSFSELRSTWHFLDNKQQIITDMFATKGLDCDLIYSSGIKPISITQLNTKTNQATQIELTEYFSSAWRMYFPRIKILPLKNEPYKVLIYEETTSNLNMIDFEAKKIYSLESIPKEVSSQSKHILNTAKKTLSKYFVDQNQTFKIVNLQNDTFASYRSNSNSLKILNLKHNFELNFNFNTNDETFKLSITHVAPLNSNSVLIAGFDSNSISNSDTIKPSDLKYFVFNYPNYDNDTISKQSIQNLNPLFKFSSLDKNILASFDDFLLQQVEIRDDEKSLGNMTRPIPNAFKVKEFKFYSELD
jgi:von Willebrand factor A domain-containing protein 8